MFATQINAAIQPKIADANSKEDSLFTSEIEPDFTDLGTDFSALAEPASSLLADALTTTQVDFGTTMNSLSLSVDQIDDWVKLARPSFTYVSFPILTPSFVMMGTDAAMVGGDGFMFYADSTGIAGGSVDKDVTTAILSGGTQTVHYKTDVGNLSLSNSMKYTNSLVTPSVEHRWGVEFLRGQTAAQDQLKISRDYKDLGGGPLTFKTNAIFNPAGLQGGGIKFDWKTDPVNAGFNFNRKLTGGDNLEAKVNLSALDISGSFKPFGSVASLRNESGTSHIAGIRFERPDAKLFVGRGVYTPQDGSAPFTYNTVLAVFKRPDAQWEWSVGYVNSEGNNNSVMGQLSTTQPFNEPLLGIFNPKFGVRVSYSTGFPSMPGMPVPFGFKSVPTDHDGLNTYIMFSLFGNNNP